MCQMNNMSRTKSKLVMLLFSLSLTLSALEMSPPKAIRFALVGDSTVAHDQGWGNAFLDRLTGDVSGINHGHNGTSSKSFRALGDWDKVLAGHPSHILIQFGHNDIPGKGPERETDPATSYRENLVRYITEARAAGAQPILVTSLVRRTFNGDTLVDLLSDYATAARAVATEQQVPLIDLHARSKALVEQLGAEGCAIFSPPDTKGKRDLTHLSAVGGQVFAGLVIEELLSVMPLLAPYVAQVTPMFPAVSWFVAPTGNDAAKGTKEFPFATMQRAQQAASPGDVIYIRGGTYRMQINPMEEPSGLYARLVVLDKSGTPGKRIFYCAYQNEEPIFDCSDVKPVNQRVTAISVAASWVHVQGITVAGVQVTMLNHTQSICCENIGSNNTFERLRLHDSQAIGIYSVRGGHNVFLNCDAWANYDYTSDNGHGGNVDGFGCHPTKGSVGNIFRGCRAWHNSDDGYDCINSFETVTFDRCWAFANGLSPTGEKRADGNGFKVGGYGSTPVDRLPNPVPRHVVRGCVAVANRNSGFYANHHLVGGDWFNNTAYRNGANFNMLGRLPDNITDIPGREHRIINNVSLVSRGLITQLQEKGNEVSHNTFTDHVQVSEHDFMSLDEAQLHEPRQADGSLPIMTLLHLKEGSGLINAGKDVGLYFRGAQPDLGAFER